MRAPGYIQINSPVIIEAQMSTQSRDIFLSDIRSQAAVRISQGLDEERDVDGFVGLEPQAVQVHTPHKVLQMLMRIQGLQKSHEP